MKSKATKIFLKRAVRKIEYFYRALGVISKYKPHNNNDRFSVRPPSLKKKKSRFSYCK